MKFTLLLCLCAFLFITEVVYASEENVATVDAVDSETTPLATAEQMEAATEDADDEEISKILDMDDTDTDDTKETVVDGELTCYAGKWQAKGKEEGTKDEEEENKDFKRVIFKDKPIVDGFTIPIVAIVASLAVSAGIGGGGLFVPLLKQFVGFEVHGATGLSQALIFGGSTAGLILNARARHPNPKVDRILLNMDMALFLSPMEMAGAQVGVILNKLLPGWLIIGIMTVILSYTAYRTLKKGIIKFKAERAASKKAKETEQKEAGEMKEFDNALQEASGVQQDGEPAQKDSASPGGQQEMVSVDLEGGKPDTKEMQEEREAIAAYEKCHPKKDWGALFLLWIVVCALIVVKGGKGAGSLVGVPPCGWLYWLVVVIAILLMLAFSAYYGKRTVTKTNRKLACNYTFVEGDVKWDNKKIAKTAAFTFLAGIIAGLVGIGGGMVLGPLMLDLGILPQIGTATTATLVVLTSSSAAISLIIGGTVNPIYAAVLAPTAFFGALAGKFYIDRIVKKYNLTSLLILLLGSIIALAVMLVLAFGISEWVGYECLPAFNEPC